MYGPVTTTPPPRRRGARVGTVLLRIVLAAVALVSMGVLAWVPMLGLAAAHRRIRDWLLFGATLAASIASVALAGGTTDENSLRSNAGTALMLGTAASAAVYFFIVDLRPSRSGPHSANPYPAAYSYAAAQPTYAPAAYPGHPGGPSPSLPRQDRIGQVRAELDELSAYLQQDHA